MAILVTGGAGFVGSHFIERVLDSSDEPIICLDNFNDFYDPAIKRANVRQFADNRRVAIVEQSFCDPPAMQRLFGRQGIRQVVHLGAYAGVRPSAASPLVYEENNVKGTLVLLEAARQFPVERFVFASSSTVYGRGAAVPFVEDQPLDTPASLYGVTKRAAELLCLNYHALYRVPAVCVRPFSVYGPRLRPDLAMSIFTAAIFAGRPFTLFGDGSIRRDFTHVSDICDGITSALSAQHVVGQAINLGHSEPVEMSELIERLETALKRRALIEYQEPLAADLPLTCADLTKARRLLGYEPKIPLAEGIQEYVDWWLAAKSAVQRS